MIRLQQRTRWWVAYVAHMSTGNCEVIRRRHRETMGTAAATTGGDLNNLSLVVRLWLGLRMW